MQPCVFVFVTYHIMTCDDGSTKVFVDDAVYVDDRDYWLTLYTPNVYNTLTCSPPSIGDALKNAINNLVSSLGIPNDVEVIFKGSCSSLVTLSFPNGSFITQPANDLGIAHVIHFTPGVSIVQQAPCNDACCKVQYEYRVIDAENGITHSVWVPISFEGDDRTCQDAELPDYNAFPNKIEAQILDPNTNTYITITGIAIGYAPCLLFCRRYNVPKPPDAILSSGITKGIPLEFSANPTLVNNFIHFTSNKSIKKVAVYDMSGKIVLQTYKLNNNEIKTSELKNGMYFLQVYFIDNDVKTIKIVKQ